MKNFHYMTYLLTFYFSFFRTGHSADVNKCFFNNSTKYGATFIDVISTLIGQKFMTEKDGYKYTVSICSDISKEHEFGCVIQNKNKEIIILGRRNDTQIIHGDSWMIVNYGSGDMSMDKKNHRRASIFIVCSPNGHKDESHMKLVEENGLDYRFILPTDSVCPYNNGISGMHIFLIIVSCTFSAYCLIGIWIRRSYFKARNFEQMPNWRFWNRIGNVLANVGNSICRCHSGEDRRWSAAFSECERDDRDDALLRP